MVQAILVWSGAVLAIVVLLLMALGPVIVEVDSWWYERKHSRKRSTAAASADSPAEPASAGAPAAPASAGAPATPASAGSAGSGPRAHAPAASAA